MTGPFNAHGRRRLKTLHYASIGSLVSFRPLSAILIAFAMLFAPLAMQSGGAMAMAPADHHSQMMEKGHCGDQPMPVKHGKSMGKSCCVAMCTAIAVAPTVSVEPMAFARMIERPSLEQSVHGYLAKLPTPPPRRA